jgi:hypothetical protein
MCEEGEIYRTIIPGTRKGKIIFYVSPKEYHIVVESKRITLDVYVFFKYKRQKFYIITEKCWKLDGCFWKEEKNKVFFEGDLLKVI